MSQQSAIEWTEATLNPWTGCTKVSPGCAHCYIEHTPPFRMAGRRFEGGSIPLVFHLDRLERMVRRRRPTLYFVNSLSDLFHDDAPVEAIAAVFTAIAKAPQHTFQILTKRPERMRALLNSIVFASGIERAPGQLAPWPLPNVWLGVSIENRRFVHRADLLRETPAAVRFVSAEPLLGPLVPGDLYVAAMACDACGAIGCNHGEWLRGDGHAHRLCGLCAPALDLTGIDWLITGGESGAQHRPMRVEWLRDIRDACVSERVAYFHKQNGGRTPKAGGRELDGRTWDELPRAVAA